MAINVLIVLDGSYRFKEPAAVQDFTFITLVETLQGAGFNVTRAHRDHISDTAVADDLVDIQDFNFDTHGPLLNYDVIWMIGHEGRNEIPGIPQPDSGAHKLSNVEITALCNYMNAGGGIFATGDHDSIGADMCGYVPRIRTMRAWFGPGDSASPMPNDFPRNFPPTTSDRADTTQKNPMGDYDLNDDSVDDGHVYFENQSDSIPQPIEPLTTPTHEILRYDGHDITVYPDHMHEGQTLGFIDGELDPTTSLGLHHLDHTLPAGTPGGFVEFPTIDGNRELPTIIARGKVLEHSQRWGSDGTSVINSAVASEKDVNSLTVYNGRTVGVGRIVTGSTFHHYIDINLTGDTDIVTNEQKARTGEDAEKGQGFNYPGAESTFENIKAVYINITKWLARVRPKIELILERSTFSQDEVSSVTTYDGAFLVAIDGVKPSQFPGGPIDPDIDTPANLNSWAPTISISGAAGTEVTAIAVDSDNPDFPEIIQRITFTYRLRFLNENAFSFPEDFKNFQVNAILSTPASDSDLTDSAWMQLVKSANPFMLDLDGGNTTTWLSSDVRVFPVVAGQPKFGHTLPDGATKAQAYSFIQNVLGSLTVSQFESLETTAAESALSPFSKTTASNKNVYNFAIARVRLNGNSATANNVRVFFRIFTSQTTAALTYIHPSGGEPTGGYKRTTGANPIAIPGTTSGGSEWLSFPFFGENRAGNPIAQVDSTNVQNIAPTPGSEVNTFFGALIDNNLEESIIKPSPTSGDPDVSLSSLLMGEHQCLVAQIEFAGTPIPSGSKPNTSDKLSQRNIAISSIANPGMSASRMALHTFEIEATPKSISSNLLPDELMIEWQDKVPDGTEVSVLIPSWDAHQVIALANNIYPRHNLIAEDNNTVSLPGGGTSYIPITRSQHRQTGILMVNFPLGIKKGQRYDVTVRQITNRIRRVKAPTGEGVQINRKDAIKRFPELVVKKGRQSKLKKGVFEIGNNHLLYTDLSFFNAATDDVIIYQPPKAEEVEKARRQSGIWRETIGSFQLGIPVSVKDDMLGHYMRLYSIMSWRLEMLDKKSRWFKTFGIYVELIAKKLQALGGNPFAIPPTPGGEIDGIPGRDDDKNPNPGGSDNGSSDDSGTTQDPNVDDTLFGSEDDDWLAGTSGLGKPEKVKPIIRSGKVSGLLYDHFGDFEGFTIETYGGNHIRFFSRESAIENIAENAWIERYVVTVVTVSGSSRKVRRLLIRGYSNES